MRKHSIRDSLKSFFEPHLHPDSAELLKGTKTEIDGKVKRILGIVESGDIEEDESKREVVAELVKEFYKDYESLYRQYDDLTGEIRKKVHGKGDNESSSSSSSDSDSDKKSKRNGHAENNMKQMEAANLEIADLKRKLETTVEEKEAVESEHQETLKKLKESEDIIGDLRLETERLATANKELNQKLEAAGDAESALNQKLEDVKKERDGLEADLEKKSQEVTDNNRLQAQTEAELEREKQEKASLLNQLNAVQNALLEQEGAYNTLSQEHRQVNALFQEREATIKKLTGDYKQAREMLEEYMSKLEETERRMQETGKDVTSRESEIEELQDTVERLRNQVEMKGEEVENVMEKMNNIEVKLRLSNQKLRVTEQVLREREEELKSVEAKYLEKQALLHQTYRGLIKEMSERVNLTILDRFQTLSEKVEVRHGSFEVTVVEATKMLLKAKECVVEMKKEKEEMEKGREEMEKKLEGRVREEEREKGKLKEALLGLGEEKREAIRQLCVWTEHHRDRCEYLEEVLSKMAVARGGQRRSQQVS
ncbi:unnamed protein product [Eruca vesicaria subsp. sativa]|uniref:NAB domain-containing protein n=1 Tax=Eruca vesicaria subsp. sativa TaxID=29727 RepID=A0ABC8LG82_ERUVS|nr:unnamed protein product [Eruca vesicaria subsp. sativa]